MIFKHAGRLEMIEGREAHISIFKALDTLINVRASLLHLFVLNVLMCPRHNLFTKYGTFRSTTFYREEILQI